MPKEIKTVKDETIDENPLPELTPWDKIGGRPTSLRDLSASDADKLDNTPKTGDFGNLAWEDVADEIHIKTGAITETKISDDSISTPKIKSGAITSAKVTTGELITLSAQIRDAIINDAHIDYLSANKITVGELEGITLTGNLLRTDKSGNERIEIAGNDDTIKWYDSYNTEIIKMHQTIGAKAFGYSVSVFEGSEQWPELFLGYNDIDYIFSASLSVGNNSLGIENYQGDVTGFCQADFNVDGTLTMTRLQLPTSLTNTNGFIYHDTANNRIRVRLGGLWRTVDTTYES